jgi:hypothetical protein
MQGKTLPLEFVMEIIFATNTLFLSLAAEPLSRKNDRAA